MKKLLTANALFILITVLLLSAGNSSVQAVAGTDAATMSATMASTMSATMTATPLNFEFSPLKLSIISTYNEFNSTENPKYTLKVTSPVLVSTGSQADDKSDSITNFNNAVQALTTKTTDGFKKELTQLESNATLPPELSELGSYVEIQYHVLNSDKGIISIKFDVFYYYAGAAHPNSNSISLNYDIKAAKTLALAGLFKPNAKYLDVLSQYCTKTLKAAGKLAFPEGVLPKTENYANWNITDKGLQITFDSYQVAPYAAGPQVVVVPYSALKSIIDDKSILSQFAG